MKIYQLVFFIIFLLLFCPLIYASYNEDKSIIYDSKLQNRIKANNQNLEIFLPDEIWLRIMQIKRGGAKLLFAVNKQCNRVVYSKEMSNSLYHYIPTLEIFNEIKDFLPVVFITFPIRPENIRRLSNHKNLQEIYIKSQINPLSVQILVQANLSELKTLRLGKKIEYSNLNLKFYKKFYPKEWPWQSCFKEKVDNYLTSELYQELKFKKKMNRSSVNIFEKNLKEYKKESDIGLEFIRYLIRGEFLNLVDLDLSSNRIDSEGIEELVKGNFKSIRFLNLSNNNIKNLDANKFNESKFISLQILNLSHNPLTMESYISLGKIFLPKLEQINLSHAQADDEGVLNLMRGKFPKLKQINLEGNYNVKDIKSLIAFYNGETFSSLKINLQDTSIPIQEIAHFIRYFFQMGNLCLKKISLNLNDEYIDSLSQMLFHSRIDISNKGIYILTINGYIKFPYLCLSS